MKKCSIQTSLGAQLVKNLPAIQETQVQSVGQKDPLEKGMATHSSILTWKIPWTEEPGGLPSIGSHRVRQDWATNTLTFSSAVVTTHVWLTELLICGSYSLRNWIFSEFYLILINSNLCRHLWPLATVLGCRTLNRAICQMVELTGRLTTLKKLLRGPKWQLGLISEVQSHGKGIRNILWSPLDKSRTQRNQSKIKFMAV